MTKILLFLISYIPLYIIIFANCVTNKLYSIIKKEPKITNKLLKSFCWVLQNETFALIMIILIILPSIIFGIQMCYKIRINFTGDSLTHGLSSTKDAIGTYLMTYILPFTSIGSSNNSKLVIGNILLFLIIMILFVRLDTVYLNPPLILIGFNIFSDSNDRYYMTRNTIIELSTAMLDEQKIYPIRITDSFYFIKKIKTYK